MIGSPNLIPCTGDEVMGPLDRKLDRDVSGVLLLRCPRHSLQKAGIMGGDSLELQHVRASIRLQCHAVLIVSGMRC